MKKLILILILFFSYQPAANAYLDPGSGSMLLSAIVGILATIFFSIKGLYYKIKSFFLRMFGIKVEKNIHELVFYSEGKYYWNTFKPILEALDAKGVEAVYMTSSEEDEGLNFKSDYISTRYIGEGNRAYTYLNMLEAKVCVMTTPGIGVLQIQRSKGVNHYAHVVHAPTDMGTYKLYSFEYYDSIFCSGAHQERTIRFLEQLRGFDQKLLVKAGCPYMDVLAKRLDESKDSLGVIESDSTSKTVLIAPTWGDHNLLKQFGSAPIKNLLDKGYNVIIRPHPQSYVAEPEVIESIKLDLASYQNVSWDSSPDNFESLRNSDVLISALSGIVFDYAFVFEKPVITVNVQHSFLGQEANDLPYELWELEILDKIGKRITPEEFANVSDIVGPLLLEHSDNNLLAQLRDEHLYNYKHSGEVIATNLINIMEEIKA